MRTMLHWGYSHPRSAVALIAILTLIACLPLKRLRTDVSIDGLTMSHDPARSFYEESRGQFGSDVISVVCIRDAHLFSVPKLRALQELVLALEELPGVKRAESLFSVHSVRAEDDALYAGPLIPWPPETDEEVRVLRGRALANEILVGNVVSSDAQTAAINLYLDSDNRDPRFLTMFSGHLEETLSAFTPRFAGVFQSGRPYNVWTQAHMLSGDQRLITPIAVGVLLLSLMLALRSSAAMLLPLLTAGISVVWTLGFMGWVGIPITVLTFVVPSLIIVVGSTEDIHILSEYLEAVRDSSPGEAPMIRVANHIGPALALTAVTTTLGFLSIAINDITFVRQFGFAAGFGMLANAVVTFLLAPAFLRVAPLRPRATPIPWIVDRWLGRAAEVCIAAHRRRRLWTLVVVLSALGIFGLWATRVRVDNNSREFFKKDSEILRRARVLHETLSGGLTFYIRISGKPGDFRSPDVLRCVASLQDYMADRGWFDKTTTLTDYLTLVHREVHGGETQHAGIPETEQAMAECLLLMHHSEIERYVNTDFSELNILVRHDIGSSARLNAILLDLDRQARALLPSRLTCRFTGQLILVNKAVKAIARGQVIGVGLAALGVALAMSFCFGSVRAGVVSLLPNLLPLVIGFGAMGLAGIPLNTATCMMAPVAIGIAMDDTIHIMVRFRSARARCATSEEAVGVAIRSEIRPVLCTSVALALGFAVLAFSKFVPIVHFGLVSALVLLVAVFTDLFVTPLLLRVMFSSVDRRPKRAEPE